MANYWYSMEIYKSKLMVLIYVNLYKVNTISKNNMCYEIFHFLIMYKMYYQTIWLFFFDMRGETQYITLLVNIKFICTP